MNYNFDNEREMMLQQIKSKGSFSEPVLDAFNKVPRHLFVSPNMQAMAYQDNALPIDSGQTISQPYTVAFMTEELKTYPNCKVLEIGTGSGYQTAILCELSCDVYTIERIPQLYEKSAEIFKMLNIEVKQFLGDGSEGLPEYAPFDRILAAAAAPKIPQSLIKQLSIGGILIIPIGSKETQTMTVVKRISNDDFKIEKKFSFRFVPLIGKEGWSDA